MEDLLELTPKKDVLFIIGDWNASVGSQETPGVTGKFGLGIQKEAGQRLIELCQENTLVIASTLFQQHKRRLYTRSGRSPGVGNGNPLQYSCLENATDRGAWWATVHEVTKSRTQLSD